MQIRMYCLKEKQSLHELVILPVSGPKYASTSSNHLNKQYLTSTNDLQYKNQGRKYFAMFTLSNFNRNHGSAEVCLILQ